MKSIYFDLHNPSYDFEYLFLVEGKDDALFLELLFSQIPVNKDTSRIIVCEGTSGIGKHLSLLVKSFAFFNRVKSVSLFRDADNDFNEALSEIHRALKRYKLPEPGNSKFVIENGKKFGVYLFPRPDENGDLERLALELAEESEELKESNDFIDRIFARNPAQDKIYKRKVQTYLAAVSPKIRQTVGWAFKDGTISVPLNSVPTLAAFIKEAIE